MYTYLIVKYNINLKSQRARHGVLWLFLLSVCCLFYVLLFLIALFFKFLHELLLQVCRHKFV